MICTCGMSDVLDLSAFVGGQTTTNSVSALLPVSEQLFRGMVFSCAESTLLHVVRYANLHKKRGRGGGRESVTGTAVDREVGCASGGGCPPGIWRPRQILGSRENVLA